MPASFRWCDMSNLPFIEETQLPGGPLVVTHAMPESQSVALGIFVDVGSRDESGHEAGIAHALEHMLFKGTEALDVHALSEQLDLLGGNANAFTSRERTCFHLQVLYEDWQTAFGLLADMLLQPALPEDEWQREREVIYAEMGMVEDMPDDWTFDQHLSALFPGQTLGRPTLGTREALAALTAADLRRYLENNYRPPRLLITAAGRIGHQALVDAVAARDWPQAGTGKAREASSMQGGVQWLPRSVEQAQVVASWPGIRAASDERPLAWLANQMLGGGMSSSLFREVRERRGLAYSVGSHLSSFSDGGMLTIGCGTHPASLSECLQVLRDTVHGFADAMDERSLQRARRQLEVQFRMGMDSAEGHMLYLGGRLDEAVLISQGEWIERMQGVQLEELRAWTRKVLAAVPLWSICAPEKVLQSVKQEV